MFSASSVTTFRSSERRETATEHDPGQVEPPAPGGPAAASIKAATAAPADPKAPVAKRPAALDKITAPKDLEHYGHLWIRKFTGTDVGPNGTPLWSWNNAIDAPLRVGPFGLSGRDCRVRRSVRFGSA